MASFFVSETAGDQVLTAVDVIGIVWTGSTTAANICSVKEVDGEVFWEGRADSTDTYLGIRFPDEGIRLQNGLEVHTIDAGKVIIYFREP